MLFARANFDVPVLFHVVVEFLDTFNSVDGPKTLVAHEPMGFLLGQSAEPLERGLGNFFLHQCKASSHPSPEREFNLTKAPFASSWNLLIYILKSHYTDWR